MKAILEFQLPEESVEFALACASGALSGVVDEVRQHVRNRLKYFELGAEATRELEDLQRVLHEAMASLPESLR